MTELIAATELKAVEIILRIVNKYQPRLSPASKKYVLRHLVEVEFKDVARLILFK